MRQYPIPLCANGSISSMKYSETWHLGSEQEETVPQSGKSVGSRMNLHREFVEFHAL